ncbi:hypothetical protein [Saccharicrinis sp. FJH62]|uniref:hypothetical protein n=1 Tax=Saccharicrinis sp. FJH62 TaxID=3344657 RepID=UPI0035D4302E
MELINTNQQGKQRPIDFIEKGISPEYASQIILYGVKKNKSLIIFPTSFKIYYYLTKIFGFIDKNMTLKMIRNFRKNDRLE